MVQQVLEEAAAPLTRLAELPGRGVTRVWECAGPRGAETLMLIHGLAFTAELNWGKVSRRWRVISMSSLPTCVATATGSGSVHDSGSRIALTMSQRWREPLV